VRRAVKIRFGTTLKSDKLEAVLVGICSEAMRTDAATKVQRAVRLARANGMVSVHVLTH
jgi:hypothetical protein